MKKILTGLTIVLIIFTAVPVIKQQAWWIRMFDFPQLQIAGLLLASLIAWIFYFKKDSTWDRLVVMGAAAAFIYLSYFIFPYTFLASHQVLDAETVNDQRSISLLSANVLMENRESQKCLGLINQRDPDLVLLLETNQWWIDEMVSLEKSYPYQVKVPMDNTYGMVLYSKFPLVNSEVKYLIEEEVPSIHSEVRLPSGHHIKLHCLHPKPPSPTETDNSKTRDAELLLVAKSTGFNDRPTIVAGDLNDVAWSHTTRLFQRISGLLDPRIGRGSFNTYHAHIPLFRWPLDHVFHSNDFTLRAIERLGKIGSDHFPIYVKLQLDELAEIKQPEPTPDQDDHQEAEEKIKEGRLEGKF